MKRLYLIRHGHTEANEKHLYCGSTDLPLSAEGIQQLKKLQYEFSDTASFYTSGMRRTEQTLSELFGDVSHKQDLRFREMDFGMFEMHSYKDLKDVSEYQKWISGDNEFNVPPNGESGHKMQIRVLEGLEDIMKRDGDIVLITHGGVIAIIMSQLFPKENKNRYEWQPKPGFGYLVEDGYYKKVPKENPDDYRKR